MSIRIRHSGTAPVTALLTALVVGLGCHSGSAPVYELDPPLFPAPAPSMEFESVAPPQPELSMLQLLDRTGTVSQSDPASAVLMLLAPTVSDRSDADGRPLRTQGDLRAYEAELETDYSIDLQVGRVQPSCATDAQFGQPSQDDLARGLRALDRALRELPPAWHRQLFERIALVDGLASGADRYGGVAYGTGCVILDVSSDEDSIRLAALHELVHVAHGYVRDWAHLWPTVYIGWDYADGADNPTRPRRGFADGYGMTSPEEDVATIGEALLDRCAQLVAGARRDPKLQRKVEIVARMLSTFTRSGSEDAMAWADRCGCNNVRGLRSAGGFEACWPSRERAERLDFARALR